LFRACIQWPHGGSDDALTAQYRGVGPNAHRRIRAAAQIRVRTSSLSPRLGCIRFEGESAGRYNPDAPEDLNPKAYCTHGGTGDIAQSIGVALAPIILYI
jgi:hypothetical protein